VARVAATGPMKSTAARQMRATAQVLDADHPEMVAGDHLRDAAKLTEHGSLEGAKRHLDAAMELLTPQNLRRHGILDDEGHATGKHHMHQIHRHHLIVQDIEDVGQRNDQLRSAARALRGDPEPQQQQPVALAVELSLADRFFRYKHGWIPITGPGAAKLHGQVLHGQDRHFRPVHGRYDHITHTIDDAKRGKVPVRNVARHVPQQKQRGPFHLLPHPALGLANTIDLKASTAWLHEKRGPNGEWTGKGGVYHGGGALPAVGYKGSPLGRKISNKEFFGALNYFESRTGQVGAPPRPPGFVGRKGDVFGRHLSAKEARGAAEALAPKPMSEYPHGMLPGQWEQFKSLTKPQKVIYNKLRKRGRQHAGAHIIAKTFQPGMLQSAVLSSLLPGIELVGPHGYVHGWVKVGASGVFAPGTLPGSFEHIKAIEDLGDRAALTGDPATRSPVMQSALHNVAKAVAGRDMHRARVHLAMARWANQKQASGRYTRELADLNGQLRMVPPGVTGWEGRVKNPLSAAGQHPGSFQAAGAVPAHVTKGASRTSYQAYSTPLEMSARTAMLERTPAPRGRPGGPGLYHVKGLGHTPYFQQVVKALMEKRGMPSDKAYKIAWGALRKWRRGGGHVHPEVRAAASGALAGEAAKGALAHSHAVTGLDVADALVELACEQIDLVGPKGYVHGWIKVAGAKSMNRAELESHLANHHGGNPVPPGRSVGPRKMTIAQLRARHDEMHEQGQLGTGHYHEGPSESAVASRDRARERKENRDAYTRQQRGFGPHPPNVPVEQQWATRRAKWQARHGSFANDGGSVLEFFNPYHAPPGAGGGQFTTQQGAGQQQKQKQQKQRAARQDRRGDRAQRQQLTRKIAGLRSQIAALQAQLPHPRTARKATTAKAKTAAQQAAAAKRATAAKSASATPRKKGVAKMSPATIHAKIAALRATLRADIAQLRAIH
jgi:hypothetical protein